MADNKYPGTYCGCPNGGDSEAQFPRFDAEKLERKEERDLSKLGDVLSWKVDALELGYIVACWVPEANLCFLCHGLMYCQYWQP